jgi:hypothetical protein
MTTETTYDKKTDKTNTYNKMNNPQDNSIAGETTQSPRPEAQAHKENTSPNTNYRANRDTSFNANEQNANMRSPSNQDSTGNKADTGANDRVAAPNDKAPIAGGNGMRMGSSDDAAIAPKTREPSAAPTQTFGRRDDTQKPNTAAKKIDEDATDEQRMPQTYDSTGKKTSDTKN